MSSTNKTATIELSQYVGTDKPTYLVDYNSDMLKIDNAIATDRDAIDTAQNKADEADSKADANSTSIENLSNQINAPTTGVAARVESNTNNINTINALIGNGSPTTSDQTVIGAINGIEGTIAPREDNTTLGAAYNEGDQFARGGSLYTALTSLTAGTAFSSLVLGTDYKVSETLVEQIANVTPGPGPTPASSVELQRGTLATGQTSVTLTFAAQPIRPTSLIDVYVADGIQYTNIALTSTTVELTFPEQAANLAVAVRVTN